MIELRGIELSQCFSRAGSSEVVRALSFHRDMTSVHAIDSHLFVIF